MEAEINYTDINRKMWNLTAEINQKDGFSELLSAIKNPAFSSFDAVEKELFTQFPLNGKDVLQIGCNSGQELCSVKRAGAGRCVGVDISDAFIEQARVLAQHAELDIEFICSNIFDLENQFQRSFDLVYITAGVLGWMPDLPRLLALIHSWLKPNGQLFMISILFWICLTRFLRMLWIALISVKRLLLMKCCQSILIPKAQAVRLLIGFHIPSLTLLAAACSRVCNYATLQNIPMKYQ